MHVDASIFLITCTDQQAPPKMLKAISTNFEPQRNSDDCVEPSFGVHIIKKDWNTATINKTTNCSRSNQKEP